MNIDKILLDYIKVDYEHASIISFRHGFDPNLSRN